MPRGGLFSVWNALLENNCTDCLQADRPCRHKPTKTRRSRPARAGGAAGSPRLWRDAVFLHRRPISADKGPHCLTETAGGMYERSDSHTGGTEPAGSRSLQERQLPPPEPQEPGAAQPACRPLSVRAGTWAWVPVLHSVARVGSRALGQRTHAFVRGWPRPFGFTTCCWFSKHSQKLRREMRSHFQPATEKRGWRGLVMGRLSCARTRLSSKLLSGPDVPTEALTVRAT